MADASNLGATETAFFRALEESLFEPGVRSNLAEAGRLLADEFIEFGGDGSVSTRAEVLAWMQNEAPSKRALSDFRAMRLADDVVLVTYRSTRSGAVDESARHSLRSSIWKQIGADWQMIFHQGTLTAPEHARSREQA